MPINQKEKGEKKMPIKTDQDIATAKFALVCALMGVYEITDNKYTAAAIYAELLKAENFCRRKSNEENGTKYRPLFYDWAGRLSDKDLL